MQNFYGNQVSTTLSENSIRRMLFALDSTGADIVTSTNRHTSLANWIAALGSVLLIAGCSHTTRNSDRVQTPAAAEARIWAMELAIFEGRGQGDISNYLNVASDHYLGWPPVLPTPTTLATLRASADKAVALNGEVCNLTRKGFTMNGNVAIMYFLNHRTRLGEGMASADERDVSQYYENVHIWNLEDGQWRLIGGFARTVEAPRG